MPNLNELPPIRYMGTKRHIASRVRRIVDELRPSGRVVDLFAGLGSVTTALAPRYSVAYNDSQRFVGPLARARFINTADHLSQADERRLWERFDVQRHYLASHYKERILAEKEAFSRGQQHVKCYLDTASHVGNDLTLMQRAEAAKSAFGHERYALTVLYFSGGYFTTTQAIELDALRFAIDSIPKSRDHLLAAWLSAAAALINSPGHTAQYLRPSSAEGYRRLKSQWKRTASGVFRDKLQSIRPLGTSRWRTYNTVHHLDAVEILDHDCLNDVRLVYADPPYTKDQYSRFYHVYETLFLYDFPRVSGRGRYRDKRFRSGFSLSSRVEGSFRKMLHRVATGDKFFVLSYPSTGLLEKAGCSLRQILSESFKVVKESSYEWKSSTMGAARGRHHVEAVDRIFVCKPR